MFNDDIQVGRLSCVFRRLGVVISNQKGTAATALAGIFGALKVQNKPAEALKSL